MATSCPTQLHLWFWAFLELANKKSVHQKLIELPRIEVYDKHYLQAKARYLQSEIFTYWNLKIPEQNVWLVLHVELINFEKIFL